MEKAITREILKNTLSTGTQPAIEFLYAKYSEMLYGYVLQFIPDEQQAEDLLVKIFTYVSERLEEACDSSLSVYCWLQIEARKIILHYKGMDADWPYVEGRRQWELVAPGKIGYYFTLLKEASYEQKWIFHELFLVGKCREDIARLLDKDLPYVDRQLQESLALLKKHLP